MEASKLRAYQRNAAIWAQNFYAAANYLWTDETPSTLFPAAMANLAFACELFLKSFIADERIPHGTHDLYTLFTKDLNEERQNRIISSMSSMYSSERFYSELNACRIDFEQWRYLFENKNHHLGQPKFLSDLANTLHEIASNDNSTQCEI